MKSRPFGIEIECYIPGYFSYDERLEKILRGWRVHDDMSLGENGIELSSPVFRNGLTPLRKTWERLNKMKFRVDDSCGMHVHHDASDLSPPDIYRILRCWNLNAKSIELFINTERAWGEYSSFVEPETLDEFIELNEYEDEESNEPAFKKLEEGSFGYMDGSKAYAIEPRQSFGTLEFRQHQGTTDWNEARAWILFGRAFINRMRERSGFIGEMSPQELVKFTKVSKPAAEILLAKAK